MISATPARQVLVCFGTRPEVIKLAPVIGELTADGRFAVTTVTTAQHRQMLDQMLAVFSLRPDVDLGLMRPRQGLTEYAARALDALGRCLSSLRPEAVLVQGDTTTAFCAALAAFHARIPVAHVEAGLRTHDPDRPFPEEINRRLIASVSRWHFSPTRAAADNLRREGVPESAIEVTGNTVIDALLSIAAQPPSERFRTTLAEKSRPRRLLVTLHRRETHGEPQRRLCRMLGRVARRPDVEIVFPVHLNPVVRGSIEAELGGLPNVRLIEPLDYSDFVHVMRSADLIVTDSGGVQEEAPSLNVPVIVLRDRTERPEGVQAGCALLSSTEPERAERDITRLLDDAESHAAMASARNPYGDGLASRRIVARLGTDLDVVAGDGAARARSRSDVR